MSKNDNYNFVVIDTETTGLTNKDRIIEISVLTIDPITRKVIDEYDTLINPLRDISNSHIHGLTSSMVATAPTFEEIHIYLANILENSILVAHNISFDERMLKNEFSKLGINADFGKGLCTLRKTQQKLDVACATRNIELTNAHRSLGDARATAQLAIKLMDDEFNLAPIKFDSLTGESNPRTFRRDHIDSSQSLPTLRKRKKIHFPTSNENEIEYLDLLDYFFEDGRISSDERNLLDDTAKHLEISDWSRAFLNKQYVNSVVLAAKRDGIFTLDEQNLILNLVNALEIDGYEMPDFAPKKPSIESELIKVCFTGEAVYNGSTIPREHLESISALAGFTCVNSVTKKNCNLVVAANVHTMSGKAKKARDFEIAVISIEEFIAMPGVADIYLEVNKRPDWF